MTPSIVRVHYNFNFRDGAEYDILKAQRILSDSCTTSEHLLLVQRGIGGRFDLKFGIDGNIESISSLNSLRDRLDEIKGDCNADIIHLHSMPFHEVTRCILNTDTPVVRSLHEPMLTCPGWGRFLLNSGKPCTKEFGPRCLVSAYTQRCMQSRKPGAMLDAYLNVWNEQHRFIPRYKQLVVYSDYMRLLLNKHGVENDRITRVPSPQPLADVEDIPTSADSSAQIRFIFAGRLSVSKGILLLIEAFSLICQTDSRLHLDIVGDGIHRDQVEQSVHEKRLSERVTLHGWIDRQVLQKMYTGDAIAVIPSVYPDNFPNSVAEAMVRGLPVIASTAGGTSEWFVDSVSGVSFESENVQQLAEKMGMLASDRELCRRIGIAAKERICEVHSDMQTAKAYEQLYTEVLSRA